MRTSIKKIGIIISILAVIILALVGCFCVANVNESRNELVLNNNNIMTTVSKEYLLGGNNEEMALIWSFAMQESIQYKSHIKLTLMNDWVAEDYSNPKIVTSFGEGLGFENGRLAIIEGAEITLDLNGMTIDKNLTNKNLKDEEKPNTTIIRVYGTLNLFDSKYDIAEVNRVYNAYKDQDAEAEDRVLLQKLQEINCGKLTGNDVVVCGAGAIHIDGTLNMYGGMIVGNVTDGNVGGIMLARQEAIFNMYNGLIIGNIGNLAGGIISQRGCLSIYGGIIAENIATQNNVDVVSAGGICLLMNGINDKFYMQGGIVSHNKSNSNAGGIAINGAGSSNIRNCEINNNYSYRHASGISVVLHTYLKLSNVNILNNVAGDRAAALLSTTNQVELNNVKVKNNTSYYAHSGSNDGSAGILLIDIFAINTDMNVNFQNVEISGNETITDRNLGAGTAGGLCLLASNKLTLRMSYTKIINNKSNVSVGSGFTNIDKALVSIGEGVEICSNTNSRGVSDVYLKKDQKLTICDSLHSGQKTSRIGVFLSSDYGENTFTNNYSVFNTTDPNFYFYSNNTDYLMKKNGGEVALDTANKKAEQTIVWYYQAKGGVKQTIQGDSVNLEYARDGYTITNSIGNIVKVGTNNNIQQDNVINKGTYSYSVSNWENYKNPTMTIYIEPKQVDVVWTNTDLIYNGTAQLPTAHIAEDENCVVNLIGSQINVGNGYVATATALNNNNYIMNPLTQNAKFNINKENLQVNITTNDFIKEYNGKNIVLPKDWYTMSATLLGQDSNKTLDIIYNIDYNAFIPQFNSKDTATAVGEYTISTKPFTASEVFRDNLNYNVTINYVNTGKLTITNPSVIRPTDNSGYDFMILQNNKRVSYKEKELIHGDNDSEYTNFVLGNIAPNTSVQTLLNNISFDTTLITIYNGANEIVYGENAKAIYTKNIDNGTELAVGTGWYIRYEKLTGGEETIYLSVLGDLTGDGKVNSADVNRLRQMVTNSEVYINSSEVVKLSSLIINNGKTPTNADAEILWNVVCGKIDIADFI